MYNIDSLLGKVVTLKLKSGLELITKLIGFDKKSGAPDFFDKRLIVVAEGEVATMPFTFTGNPDLVFINASECLGIFESAEASSEDYLKQLSGDSTK